MGRYRPRVTTAPLMRFPTQKSPTAGVPTAAATCSGPVSLETTTVQPAYAAASPPIDSVPTNVRAGGRMAARTASTMWAPAGVPLLILPAPATAAATPPAAHRPGGQPRPPSVAPGPWATPFRSPGPPSE